MIRLNVATWALIFVFIFVFSIVIYLYYHSGISIPKELKLGQQDAASFWSQSDAGKIEMMSGKNEDYLEGLGWKWFPSKNRGHSQPHIWIDQEGELWIHWRDNVEDSSNGTIVNPTRLTKSRKIISGVIENIFADPDLHPPQ